MTDWLLSVVPSVESVGHAAWVLVTFVLLFASVPLAALGLPGSWVLLFWGAGSYAFGIEAFNIWILLAGIVVAIGGELLEQVLGVAATKKGGGGKCGMWGAALGSLVAGLGGIFVPPPVLGAIIAAMFGAFAGAFVGEVYFAAQSKKEALRPALWAAGGRLAGVLAKIISSGIVALLLAFDLGMDLIWP